VADKAVFITGGTGSVGQALVGAFAGVGAYRVSFQYSTDTATANRLHETFGATAVRVDFAREFTLPDDEFDIVVNNAAINESDALTHDVSPAAWDLTVRLNLTIPFLIIRHYLPHMQRKKWGRIINISSIYGLRATDGRSPYVAAKHGLSGLTKTVAKEYARHGITSNEICPGPIDSKMMQEIARRSTDGTTAAIAQYFEEVVESIPANRLAHPIEVAQIALFLASAAADYVNGVSIPLDGALIA
jgi:NAD(P)-dependent dehydrogenase (short-subunit alcohol dehydrogenase family)